MNRAGSARLWYDEGSEAPVRSVRGLLLAIACAGPWVGPAGCGGEPVRGAIPTVPEERIEERPEAGPIATQPKEAPPAPELPPPTLATREDEDAGKEVAAAGAFTREQAEGLRSLSAAADAETRQRAAADQAQAKAYLDRWDQEQSRARTEALAAERERWEPHRAEGIEEWLTRARNAAQPTQHPRVVAAEAARLAQAARENADRADVRALRARREADDLRRFARVTVKEWVPIPGTGADLERTEALARQLELEALRARIASDWAAEAAQRAARE